MSPKVTRITLVTKSLVFMRFSSISINLLEFFRIMSFVFDLKYLSQNSININMLGVFWNPQDKMISKLSLDLHLEQHLKGVSVYEHNWYSDDSAIRLILSISKLYIFYYELLWLKMNMNSDYGKCENLWRHKINCNFSAGDYFLLAMLSTLKYET